MALLHLFHEVHQLMDLQLHVATLNHGLRAEAAEDVVLVEQAAAALKLPITAGKTDVPQQARQKGIGLEEAARQARYAFLASVAHNVGARKVVTAHHADDQAETVLMHLLRGSGMGGVAGMSLRSPLPYTRSETIEVIRPLLYVSGAALRAFCDERTLPYAEDVTNLDPTWLRNRIRHEVLPFLRATVNPNVDQALLRFAEISRVDHTYLEQVAHESVTNHLSEQAGRISIERNAFRSWPPSIQRHCILHVLSLYFPQATPKMKHIFHAVELAVTGDVGAVAEFAAGVRMRVGYESLHFETVNQLPAARGQYLLPDSIKTLPLLISGETSVQEMGWSVIVREGHEADDYSQTDLQITHNLPEGLVLRQRRPGDRFHPAGMQGRSQKVSDWMINLKVPRELRDRVPLLADSRRIYAILWNNRWYPGHRLILDNEKSILLRIIKSKT